MTALVGSTVMACAFAEVHFHHSSSSLFLDLTDYYHIQPRTIQSIPLIVPILRCIATNPSPSSPSNWSLLNYHKATTPSATNASVDFASFTLSSLSLALQLICDQLSLVLQHSPPSQQDTQLTAEFDGAVSWAGKLALEGDHSVDSIFLEWRVAESLQRSLLTLVMAACPIHFASICCRNVRNHSCPIT